MEDKLFDTPEKIEVAIANFADLQRHPGWILFDKIVKANIEVLKEQILTGGDEKLMDEKRIDLRAHKNIINTPANQIKSLKTEEGEKPSFDPYDKPKPLPTKGIDSGV